MFGIRTPMKKAQAEKERSPPTRSEMAGPSQRSEEDSAKSKVRRSIGEWEREGRESEPKPTGGNKQIPAARTKQVVAPTTSRMSTSSGLQGTCKPDLKRKISCLTGKTSKCRTKKISYKIRQGKYEWRLEELGFEWQDIKPTLGCVRCILDKKPGSNRSRSGDT
ncbi:unnamed protein product, partial [Iphiclides podalirius]